MEIKRQGLWVQKSAVDLAAEIGSFLQNDVALVSGGKNPVRVYPHAKHINEVMTALRSLVHAPGLKPGQWRNPRPTDPVDRNLIPVGNGLLDPSTRELFPPNPRFFNITKVEPDYDEKAECPQWLEFVDQVVPKDESGKRRLQEIFGNLLTTDTSQQKIFLFLGPPRSGKGTTKSILKRMLGNSAIEMGIGDLVSSFGLERIIGKSLVCVGDAKVAARDRALALERLLSLSGDDSPSISRKFLPAYTGPLYARMLMLANDMPYVGPDPSGAFAGRFIPVEYTQSFYGREDIGLANRLAEELSGILNWSLDGLERLQERGHFELSDEASDLLEELGTLHHPLARFLQDECRLCNPGDEMPHSDKDEFFDRYVMWCEKQRPRIDPRSKDWFFRDLRSAGINSVRWDPETRTTRKKDGKPADRYIKGWRLRAGG